MHLLVILLACYVTCATAHVDDENCRVRASCDLHEHLSDPRYRNCRCDETCSLYGDCCFNAQKQRVYLEKTIEPSCQRVMSINWRSPIQIVDSCPEPERFPNQKVVKRCEVDLSALNPPPYLQPKSPALTEDDIKELTEGQDELFLYVPVSSVRTQLLFKNVYCALCNHAFKIEFWSVNISQRTQFPEGVVENATLLSETFDSAKRVRGGITYQSSRFEARTCKVSVESCPPGFEDKNVVDKCNGRKSFTSYVFHRLEATTYRNKFCAECNHVEESLLKCVDPRDYLTGIAPYRPFPFSILLDINRHRSAGDTKSDVVGYVYESADDLCPDGAIYNPVTGHCESLICDFALLSNSTEAKEVLGECGYGNFSSENASAAVQYELVWKFAAAQGYITLVANTLSMCGLVAHLVIYSLLPALRNTPGKCLMCLSSSLLVAQFFFTFFIALTESYPVCLAVSSTIHFCFLAYFCWMNVMAMDVWRAFNSKSFHPQTSQTSRRFLCYNLYAWLVPGALVTVSIILDSTGSALRPDYASNFCWFGSRQGLIVLFAVPLALILIADVVFFTLTVLAIKKASEGAKLATQKERSQLSLYVKLASVMGLTWVSGFLAALAEVPAMWYVFILLNSSQGVVICVSFCCTKKVIRQLQERLSKYKTKRKQSVPSTQQSDCKGTTSGGSSPMILDKHGLKDRSTKV